MLTKKLLPLILCIFYATFGNAQTYDLIVAPDGSGNYTTVQAAINAAPTGSTTPYKIFIKNGKYREKITIASNKPFIQLIGESVANVFVYYDDPATVLGTQNSASFTINANDFSAFNITFANTYGDGSQAVAVLVNADRAAFKNCRFLANQDTVYLKGNGTPRAYFKDCYIDGNIDFIFGSSVAYFDNCVVYAKTRVGTSSSFITAPNTPVGQAYGFVFKDAKLYNNVGTTSYFLSRPWPSPSEALTRQKCVFLSAIMSSHIQPAGWSTWDANTVTANLTNAEYNSRHFNGNAVSIASRAPWSLQYNVTDSSNFTIANMFTGWDPCAVYPNICTTITPDIAVANFRTNKVANTSNFNWNISWPQTGIQYDLYRSSNNVSFSIINTQVAANDTAINFNYAEAVPPPGGSYYYFVRASKPGFTAHTTDTLIVTSVPTITTAGTLGNFTQSVGSPSNPQTYTVSGVNLSDNITITAPANFEISINNGISWNNSSTPIVLTPTAGSIANTNISVRLNANVVGTYNGNITHTSTGATNVNVPVNGTTQLAALNAIGIIQYWPLNADNTDSVAVRAAGVLASTPTFSRLVLSDGVTLAGSVPVPAYSTQFGQAYATTANGLWTIAAGGNGGNLSRTIYEQFQVKAGATHTVHIDSIILNASFFNTSSNTRFAIVYSKTGFTTADSTDVVGASFGSPILLVNETTGTNTNYRFAINNSAGINLNANETLTFRIYNSCSSTGNRYAKLKNVHVKGYTTLNPLAGDYQTHQSGEWANVNTWERYDGTAWVYPAPAYPVYDNSGTASILSGHTVTISSTLANGSGYIHLTKIKEGGQLIVANGATLNIANDGAPSTTTTDLQIDGTMTAAGVLGTNGNVSIVINGTLINSTTSMNLSNTGDSVFINNGGTYQHNTNSNNTPANLVGRAGSTFNVTGITSNQTGIFKANVTYGNIVWNCPAQGGYYAFRGNLSSNVLGSFTLVSSGSTYISFHNASVKTTFPGGYYQTGGIMNFREGGTVVDTLTIGGDFSVTGGTFNSNVPSGSTLALQLTGNSKSFKYGGNTLNNTNILFNGTYTLDSNLVLPTAGFGAIVNGSLTMGTRVISGSGAFTMGNNATISSAALNGLDGNINVSGTKAFGTTGNFIFNGAAAQTTGALIPANANSITVNNAAGLSLSNNTQLASTLTLTNGNLSIGNNNISTASILGANASKFIVTNGVGALKLTNIGSTNTTFPVGISASSYTPVLLNNSGTVDNFSVNVAAGLPAGINVAPQADSSVNRIWNIAEDVVGGSNATITLQWNAAEQNSLFNSNNASVVHSDGTVIDYNGGFGAVTTVSANVFSRTGTGFNNFSPFGVTSTVNAVVLPVTLLSFNAVQKPTVVDLNWNVSNQLNLQHYQIQKSSNGNTFETIGTVNAINNTQSYHLTDVKPFIGDNYYRLKSVDFNGQFSYSKIVKVTYNAKGFIAVYPNPVQTTLTVNHSIAADDATLMLFNNSGQQVALWKVKANSIQTNIPLNVAAGTYTLVFVNNNQKTSLVIYKK
ncbi:pectinesterase family protein [Ferruginibacter yonginensis]|uniref:Pectinesterase family protein n=1 Tax=Ferruginibacter yonginensis TaxID=1310416 RepID=A0ABV8QQX2_9BACT